MPPLPLSPSAARGGGIKRGLERFAVPWRNCASPVPADDRVLYVADSAESRIAVIPHALTRTTSGNIGATLAQGGA